MRTHVYMYEIGSETVRLLENPGELAGLSYYGGRFWRPGANCPFCLPPLPLGGPGTDPCQVVLVSSIRHACIMNHRGHTIPHLLQTEVKNSISTTQSSLLAIYHATGKPFPYSSTISKVTTLKLYAFVPCVASTQTTLPSLNFLSISACL